MLSLSRDGRGTLLDGLAGEPPLRVAAVDGLALEERAARLTSRSIKRESESMR